MICPDCKRNTEIQPIYIIKGYVKCRKCLQIIEIKDNKAIKVIPKELISQKFLLSL